MRIDVLTIFPGMFSCVLDESIIKRAREKGLLEIEMHDLRDWTRDAHRSVDDRPFGGGPGMVMKPEPVFAAVEEIIDKFGTRSPAGRDRTRKHPTRIILLTPQGKRLNQKKIAGLSGYKHLILICGRYEGVDERIRERLVDEEISIGDYVLTGGELPAMVLIDAVTRLIPGALGDCRSLDNESFVGNLLEYPHYTRPRDFRGMCVPEVLISGDHERIEKWRRKLSLSRTRKKRPDLIEE